MSDHFYENSVNQASPNVLIHHQIKGGKWGIHRGPPYPLENGIKTKIKRKEKSAKTKDDKKETKPKKENKRYSYDPKADIGELTNEELKERAERFRLEQDYNRYLPQEKKGKNFLQKATDVLNDVGLYGRAMNSAVEAGKKLAKQFGLTDKKGTYRSFGPTPEFSTKLLPNETLQEYTERMERLSKLSKAQYTISNFGKGELKK